MSAAKSKERKMLYANELEERVKALQIEANSVTAQVATVVVCIFPYALFLALHKHKMW